MEDIKTLIEEKTLLLTNIITSIRGLTSYDAEIEILYDRELKPIYKIIPKINGISQISIMISHADIANKVNANTDIIIAVKECIEDYLSKL